MINNFQKLDQRWFKRVFETYNVDFENPYGNSALREPASLDLSTISFTSFFNLLNLFLTIDYFQDFIAPSIVNFYGLGPSPNKELMSIDDYNRIRSNNIENLKNDEYNTADRVYGFISYLHHFGLFSALIKARSSRTVTLSGISEALLNKLYAYSSVDVGNRILGLIPIFDRNVTNELRLENSIKTWLKDLPEDFLKHPIFRDREFSRVLGYQLAYNVIEHANFKSKNGTGAQGALCMQLIEKKKYSNHRRNYPKEFKNLFNSKNNGVLEICVGDKGVGIYDTLKGSYLDLYNRIGSDKEKVVPEEDLIKEVISFAFDEIGSRKVGKRRVGGVHALHRVLKTTAKYGGVLRIRSNCYEFIYNLSDNDLVRSVDGFGFKPDSIKNVIHPFGVQFQILIPLQIKSNAVKAVPPRRNTQKKEPTRTIIIPLAACLAKEKQYTEYDSMLAQTDLATTTSNLFEEPDNIVIVYDFGGRNWTEEEIAFVLLSQKAILHTKFCVGVNVPEGLPQILREREKLRIDEHRKNITGDTDFFDVLSTKHRLFPVFDTNNLLTFLGLSEYEFDDILLNNYLSFESTITEGHTFYRGISVEEIEICKLYIKSNNQIYEPISEGEWKNKLTPALLEEILKDVIRDNFPKILKTSGCILNDENKKYILPTSKIIADKFIQVTPCFQEASNAFQIGKWFANAILSKLKSNADRVLLVSANAPSELMSKTVADALFPKKAFLLNLNLYSRDSVEVLESTEDWNLPLFIISDVFDKWKSRREQDIISEKGLKIDGLLSLIKYKSSLKDEIKVTLDWRDNESEGRNVPHFVFAEMRIPKKYDGEISSLNKEDINIIDTFSTQDFKLTNLAIIEQQNIEKLQLLEEWNLLREGHWVYEEHHFSVTICLKKLFSNNFISGQISQQILKIIRKNRINLLLMPLHSHIKEFIPTILLNIKLHLGFSIHHYYCTSTKGLTEKPFYLLPKSLEEALKNGSKAFNILILDDAISSGRTQETLLRALLRAANKNEKRTLRQVHIYAIINRLGRAKSSVWESIKELTAKKYSTKFSFTQWIALDIPVFDRDNCPMCREKRKLIFLQQALSHFRGNSILPEIELMQEHLNPHSTESPSFIDFKQRNIFSEGRKIAIAKMEVKTVELALWQFNNLLHRGYPLIYLIEELNDVLFDTESTEELVYLKSKIGEILIKSWERTHLLYAEDNVKKYLVREIAEGTEVAKNYLAYLGEILSEVRVHQSKQIILDIITSALKRISKFDKEEDFSKRDNLRTGISLCLAFYLLDIPSIIDKTQRKKENASLAKIVKEIDSFSEAIDLNPFVRICYKNINRTISLIASPNDFLSALYNVLENTVRPSRKWHAHEHQLPSLLVAIGNGHTILKPNRIVIKDAILHFLYSQEIIDQAYPTIFSEEVFYFWSDLKKDLGRLVTLIDNDENWIADQPNQQTKDLANSIYSFFPHQQTSDIFQFLKRTHLPLNNIEAYLTKICDEKGVDLEVKPRTEVNVIVPPADYQKKQIFTFLDNYIKDAKVETPSPRVLVSRIEEEMKTQIKLQILTNFCSYEDAQKSLGDTHGKLTLNYGVFKLFGISADARVIKKKEFSVEISIKFQKGFKLQ